MQGQYLGIRVWVLVLITLVAGVSAGVGALSPAHAGSGAGGSVAVGPSHRIPMPQLTAARSVPGPATFTVGSTLVLSNNTLLAGNFPAGYVFSLPVTI